jgi:uncharacterized membrane protein YfcA
MFENLWLIALGFVAGIVGSIIGLGGGIIVVPVLTILGFPHTVASSSSLFAAFSNSVASSVSYARQKRIEYKLGLKLGLMSIPGTILGAFISSEASPSAFKIMFGVVMIVSCLYLFLKRGMESKSANMTKKMLVLSSGISFIAGILSSFFGIGGGIVFVPLMILGIGISVKHATATSQLILMFSSASGMIAHSMLGHADFSYALLLGIGAFVGGLVGAKISVDLRRTASKS